MRQRTEYREVDERTKTERFTITAPWIYAPPAPPPPGADPADSSPDVAAALLELGRAQQHLAALNDRLGEGDESALADLRAAEDRVKLATARFGKQRELARSARRREADALLPEVERQVAAAAALERKLEAAHQRRIIAEQEEEALIEQVNGILDEAARRLRTIADIYPSGADSPVEYSTQRLGGGVRVGTTSYCKQPAVGKGGFVKYHAPDLAPPPPPAPPAHQCPDALAAGYGGAHALAPEMVQRGFSTVATGRLRCTHCKQVFERDFFVPTSDVA